MSLKLLVLLLCVAGRPVIAAPAAAYFWDGNWLHEQCENEASYASCQRYIIGIMDGSNAVNATLYCWPEKGTIGQAVDIVKKWLDDNPALRAMSGGKVVISSLKEAFPTRLMWQPPQEDEDGNFKRVPLTAGKSTDSGKWVPTCSGEVAYEADDIFWFGLTLPENYEVGKAWLWETFRGPE